MRYPLCFLAVVPGICCVMGCKKDMSQVVREALAAEKAAKLASDSAPSSGQFRDEIACILSR
ncbi:hypothetical protein SAMN04488128_102521 [Chitinophaga eiseniae]|uniref:Uncharacterized protein n=1 Tax=Chitinophaga eiseniae TaxID=634771 RepID=A0A1T4QQF4_9BACT|nr:hypothetical protein [Chitinophaga eiseniae]SKA05904.1 hypothetical protein SAMN04488128_102521 [Chitinophaga eiseniae]